MSVSNEVELKALWVDAGIAFNATAAAQSIMAKMISTKHVMSVGLVNAAGVHAFIAYRYRNAENYGAVVFYDAWGQAILVNLNNGTYTAKSL